ncbi:TPA: HNH endonuclease [Photobacterium damselae]
MVENDTLVDLLRIDDIDNCKIRLVVSSSSDDPWELYREKKDNLRDWLLWNYSRSAFKVGQVVIGLVRTSEDQWLLFDVVKITKDLNIQHGVGYEAVTIKKYENILGCIEVKYKNKATQLIRNAKGLMEQIAIVSSERIFDVIQPVLSADFIELQKLSDYLDVDNKIVLGQDNPKKINRTVSVYERDAAVVARTLFEANNQCELCGSSPFFRENGKVYLEVHHVKSLSDGGRDKISNTVALCPNCHKQLHFGQNKSDLLESIYNKIPRLIRE